MTETAFPRRTQPAAMTWDGSYESQGKIVTWSGGTIGAWFDGDYYLSVPTAEGEVKARSGATITVAGRHYIVSG